MDACGRSALLAVCTQTNQTKDVLLVAEKMRNPDVQVKDWLGKFQEVVYDADDLVDDLATEALRRHVMTGNRMAKEVSLCFSSSNRLVYGFKMGHKIKAIRQSLADIEANRNLNLEGRSLIAESGYTTRKRDQADSFAFEVVIGREREKKEIVDHLLDSNSEENVSVLSIVGIGGVGKTTLAKLIFNDEKVREHFDLKLWVSVSDNFDVKIIVKKILESAKCGMLEDLVLETLIRKLREIMNGKKYLLVLDDVWNENIEKWLDLKQVLMCGSRGSRILLTTRSIRIAQIVGTQPHHYLEGLTMEESWFLFKKIVFKGQEPKSSEVVEIGKQVIKKCVGVPLAINAIASILLFKDPEREWLPFLEGNLLNLADDDIFDVLKLSYDELPSHLKCCFAYCALFQKDHVIDVKTLIHLWVAQGFIQSSNSKCVEDIGIEYFKELWCRSFFQEVERDEFGNIESCKMHDLMHDFAIFVAGEGIRHIPFDSDSWSWNHFPIELVNMKKLRTLLLPSGNQNRWIDEELSHYKALFSNCRSLRVLEVHYLDIQKVLPSVKRLKHLRYIDFSDNHELNELPDSITKLLNLQVLNVSGCDSLKELPKDTRKLVNLRHLYCERCWSLTHMPRGLGQLASLQTLSCFVVDSSLSKPVARLSELNRLNDLRGRLVIRNLGCLKDGMREFEAADLKAKQYLQSLILSWDQDDYDDDCEHMALENVQVPPNLKELKLFNYSGSRLPSLISSNANLVNISIAYCRRLQHLPVLHKLPCLKKLKIDGLCDLEYIDYEEDDCLSGGETIFFPSLKYLRLWNCPNLRGWRKKGDDSTLELLQFPCLSTFICSRCPNLTWIHQLSSLDELLDLDDASNQLLHHIFTTSISSSSSSVIPPLSNLKKLWIENMADLDSLPENALWSLASLQELRILNCPRLRFLPPELRFLTSLRQLEISKCPLLEERYGDLDQMDADWTSISHIPNIQIGDKRIQQEASFLLERKNPAQSDNKL
ncbi:hypothetical protein MANES_10G139900v8 [Manihot esculenta]|uniref:Uncharacterized protein n=1 Tax=Manihot esculenta TaxID=3983 RepID=A0ACB7H5T9_MANES|nr:hypothetical protein MANES_10G139900v8 [Manihot esculenta]